MAVGKIAAGLGAIGLTVMVGLAVGGDIATNDIADGNASDNDHNARLASSLGVGRGTVSANLSDGSDALDKDADSETNEFDEFDSGSIDSPSLIANGDGTFSVRERGALRPATAREIAMGRRGGRLTTSAGRAAARQAAVSVGEVPDLDRLSRELDQQMRRANRDLERAARDLEAIERRERNAIDAGGGQLRGAARALGDPAYEPAPAKAAPQ